MPTYVENVTLYPERLIAGDSIDLDITLADYPADEYTLSYALANSAAVIEWTAAADGTDYNLAVASATTSAYTAGVYAVQVYVTDSGGERTTIHEGSLEIASGFAGADATDTRSHVKKVLDAIEATIYGTASQAEAAYSIEGRSLSRRSTDELYKLRARYLAEYRAELRAQALQAGKTRGNQVKTYFVES